MEFRKSDIVVSLAGRDKDEAFFVVETEPGWVWIANGKGRRVEKPKRKRNRHVGLLRRDFPGQAAEKLRNGERVANSELRRALAVFRDQVNNEEESAWQKTTL